MNTKTLIPNNISNMPQRKVVQVKIDWAPGVYRSDVFVYKRSYTTHLDEYGDWSVTVDFTITGNTMASFLFHENAPQYLLAPGFSFELCVGLHKVGIATVIQEISNISISREEYTNNILKLSLKEQRAEVKQFILDMLDYHEQTDEETLYIELLSALDDWNNK